MNLRSRKVSNDAMFDTNSDSSQFILDVMSKHVATTVAIGAPGRNTWRRRLQMALHISKHALCRKTWRRPWRAEPQVDKRGDDGAERSSTLCFRGRRQWAQPSRMTPQMAQPQRIPQQDTPNGPNDAQMGHIQGIPQPLGCHLEKGTSDVDLQRQCGAVVRFLGA